MAGLVCEIATMIITLSYVAFWAERTILSAQKIILMGMASVFILVVLAMGLVNSMANVGFIVPLFLMQIYTICMLMKRLQKFLEKKSLATFQVGEFFRRDSVNQRYECIGILEKDGRRMRAYYCCSQIDVARGATYQVAEAKLVDFRIEVSLKICNFK